MAAGLGWIALLAAATADDYGATTLTLKSGVVDRAEQCSTWGLTGERLTNRHADLMSHPRTGVGCVARPSRSACPNWRIAVVRDHDGQMLVDVELDEPPMGDSEQQARALAMPASGEKAAVLARWPAGAWSQTTLCPGESKTLAVEAPHRCAVVAVDGRPNPAEFGRGTEIRCAVVDGGQTGATLNGHGLPAGSLGIRLVGLGGGDAFPLHIPAGAVVRTTFALAGEQRGLHHVAYSLVAVAMAASARRAAE